MSLPERIAERYQAAAASKYAVIRKEKGKYCVRSPNNPDWNGGCFDSEEEAKKRLQQVEFFKSKKAYYLEEDDPGDPNADKVEMAHVVAQAATSSLKKQVGYLRGFHISPSELRRFQKVIGSAVAKEIWRIWP